MEPQIIDILCNEATGARLRFHGTNEMVLWRVRSLRQKEPETIAWIDTFDSNAVFLDIGANIGIYCLYAALARECQVLAFEPESLNYAMLNRNIFLNRLDQRVKAYPIALSDESAFSELHVNGFEEGSSCHSFKDKLDFKQEQGRFDFSQGCFSMTLDELIQKNYVPVPQHIKIDVDGIEHKVLKGADQLLENPSLKSVLVEINTNLPVHRSLIDFMNAKGFIFSPDQVDAFQCKEGVFKGVGNYIFFRNCQSEWENFTFVQKIMSSKSFH
ncbi:MAG: FkbM family methyltransferase [Rhabdochlamydiaceae bacterium]|nr:FkbM family methyltransferase [Rhabdochlamydiaceae bacterium]